MRAKFFVILYENCSTNCYCNLNPCGMTLFTPILNQDQPRSQGPLSSCLEKVPWLRLVTCLLDYCRFKGGAGKLKFVSTRLLVTLPSWIGKNHIRHRGVQWLQCVAFSWLNFFPSIVGRSLKFVTVTIFCKELGDDDHHWMDSAMNFIS